MPSRHTHLAASHVCLLPVFLILLVGLNWHWYDAGLVVLGMWLGEIYLSPDLDTKSRPFYRWGFFRFIWWPYQWLVKHRSVLSHHIWVGTFFRVLYFSCVCILSYMAIRVVFDDAVVLPQLRSEVLGYITYYKNQLLCLGVGVWIGSFLHIVLDNSVSWLKRNIGRL